MNKINIPPEAKVVLETLLNNGYDAYVVGGCVRDSLLGRVPKDWDICTSATPNQVTECFPNRRIVETGLRHGTVTVFVGDMGFEVTTFRTDGEYTDGRRPDFVEFVGDVFSDLSRRDFTINAMAYNEASGLIDPFGGEKDLKEQRIKCVGDPNDRFSEDALRILRALRFSSVYGFHMDSETNYAIHKNVLLLGRVSAERINAELCKLLMGQPFSVLSYYPDVFTTIIPVLKPCLHFEQNNRFHCFDVYSHIVFAVGACTGDLVSRLALLLHDIGKPYCYTEDSAGGHFYGHNVVSAEFAEETMSQLRFDRKTRDNVVELVMYHDHLIVPSRKAVKRWLGKLGEEQFFRLMCIKQADALAHAKDTQTDRISRNQEVYALAKEIIEAKELFTIDKLAINGHDVMQTGIPQGAYVGLALKAALAAVIDGRVSNTKAELLDYLRENAEALGRDKGVTSI